MEWFIGDYHFGHYNIMRYCHRPFASTDEMDAVLAENTNNLVGRGDLLYFLGDWSFKNLEKYRRLINCPNIHFIRGNHDKEPDRVYRDNFTTVRDLNNIKVILDGNRQSIVLCHYAMRVWNKSHHGAWHLYGHSHGTLPDWYLSTDVGVDAIAQRLAGFPSLQTADGEEKPDLTEWYELLKPEDYRPINLREVAEIMATKSYKPVDHHGATDEG